MKLQNDRSLLLIIVISMICVVIFGLQLFNSASFISQALEYGIIRRIGIKRSSQINKTRIAVVGDIACTPASQYFGGTNPQFCQHEKVRDLIVKEGANYVLLPGDLQYENGTLQDFNQSFSQFAQGLTPKLKPVPGNHEYYTPSANGYWDYFGSQVGIQTGVRNKGWYSFDVGSWHIIGLNSNCTFVGCGVGSEQYNWLVNDLTMSTKPCTIAFWHHPMFNSGSTHGNSNSMSAMWNLLDARQADIVVQAHDHLYERFGKLDVNGNSNSNGIRSYVSGLGGKNKYPFGAAKPGSEFRYNANYGALFFTLDQNSYSWEFKSISGAPVDSGTSNCV
jgi:acid phosphatase type 7